MTHGSDGAGRTRPAWRTLAPGWNDGTLDEYAFGPAQLERLRPTDASTDRNTDAEYTFYRLHGRFQRWADELFFADERLLAFVPWTAGATEAWWRRIGRRAALGGRQAAEGALVLTDQQTLLLRDDADPAGGALFWGYTARAIAHERLEAVEVHDESGGAPLLRLVLAALGGRETVEWRFPPAVAADVRALATLLAAFPPRPADGRLRRLGRIRPLPMVLVPPSPTPRRANRAQSLVTPEERAALDDALRALVAARPAPGGATRRIHARGIGLEAGQCDAPRLLAVTQEHLFVVPFPGHGEPVAQRLAAVTSVELRRSVLGHHVAWTAGRDGVPARRERLPFPPPALADCFAVFAALRQALTLLPVQARGPDLPEELADGAAGGNGADTVEG